MAKGMKPSRRKKTSSKNYANLQAAKAVKEATAEAKAAAKIAREKQKQALARSGQTIKDFRHAVSLLKKAGVVSKRTDARRQNATKYMRQKVRDFYGVVVGTEQAVAVPRETREQYRESGVVKMKGRFAILPKQDKDQALKIRKGGLIEIVKPVGRPDANGRRPSFMAEVILPFKLTSMHMVAEKLATDPTLDGLKEPTEYFGARIFGHNINQGLGYPDAAELGDYILRNYQHLMKGRNDRKSVKYFSLYRFWSNNSIMADGDEGMKVYDDDYRKNRKQRPDPREGSYMDRKRKRRAAKKAAARAAETPEKREERLARQRARQAKLRNDPFYKRPDTKG